MTDSYKFPGGNDVTVVRKQDIIDCIDCNIVDKDVALEIIQQCKTDAANFLRQGRWVGIPFLGSIRPNLVKRLEKSKEQQELIKTAYTTATKEQYCVFRKELAADNVKRIKAQRYYNFVLSKAVNKNKQLFKKMCKEKGEAYTRIHFFLRNSIVAVSNELDYEVDG